MRNRMGAGLAAIALILTTPAWAQPEVTGARPGNDIGTGMSLPRSDKASNIDPSNTRSEIAPNLPAPPDTEDTRQLLMTARAALMAHQTGAAQEALERAETRALDRSVPAGSERYAVREPLIDAVTQARLALANGNISGAIGVIDSALAH